MKILLAGCWGADAGPPRPMLASRFFGDNAIIIGTLPA
jgi:hypothetical protein